MSDTDHWRTHPEDFADLARLGGLLQPCEDTDGNIWPMPAVDLDPATNEGSLIPCRVGLVGDGSRGPICHFDYGPVAGTPVTLGGSKVNASGLRDPWPGALTVWNNPPYSNPSPWVVQIILHIAQGGRGAGVLPCNLLESAWGQALLLMAGCGRRVIGAGPGDGTQPALTRGTAVLHALFAARGVPSTLGRYLQWCLSEVWPYLNTVGLYIPSRRVGFIDPEGDYQGQNRQGTMAVLWGLPPGDPRAGLQTLVWPRREQAQGAAVKWDPLSLHDRQ